MRFLRNTFLGRVLREDRWLGGVFAIFIVVQLLAQAFTAEVTPFFLFGMYSEPIHPSPTYVRVTCEVNGRPLVQEDLPRYAGELFFSTLYRYEALDAANGKDLFEEFIKKRLAFLPERTKVRLEEELAFDMRRKQELHAWMKRYLSRVTGSPVRTVLVSREMMRYEDGRPEPVTQQHLLGP